MKVVVLLCTYNGAAYLSEQLSSLLRQDYPHWVCHAYDDCSTDETFNILSGFALKYPGRFVVSRNKVSTGSASRNFSSATAQLHRDVKFELLAFCDQDDVWAPDKLSSLIEVFASHGNDLPLLAFCDLSVVSAELAVVKPSFVRHISAGGFERHMQLGLLDVDNVVPGCAMMCNRALLYKALPISSNALMHDWWLVLTARKFGALVFVPRALVQYRQHESNSVGAKKMSLVYKLLRARVVASKFSRIMQMHRDLGTGSNGFVLLVKYVYAKMYKFICYR
jgi:glycosyltransferase involved in cell wall biosynthesis